MILLQGKTRPKKDPALLILWWHTHEGLTFVTSPTRTQLTTTLAIERHARRSRLKRYDPSLLLAAAGAAACFHRTWEGGVPLMR